MVLPDLGVWFSSVGCVCKKGTKGSFYITCGNKIPKLNNKESYYEGLPSWRWITPGVRQRKRKKNLFHKSYF